MNWFGELLASPRFSSVLTTVGIGLGVFAFPIHQLIGYAGHISALVVTGILMIASLILRRATIERRWLLPISLLAAVGWAGLSIIWSNYQWVTLGSLVYFGLFTVMGVFIGLSRDTIQILRSMGDVLRVALGASLVIEVFSGILIDAPVPLFAVRGEIATGGSISGLLATRNQLGLVAVIAAITFVIEWRTRSVRRGVAILSLVMAALCIGLTRSPIVWMVAAGVFVAAGVLYGIRRVPLAQRTYAQYAALAAGITLAVLAWAFRGSIVALFNARGELEFRLALWRDVMRFVDFYELQGWGWIGRWNEAIPPYTALTAGSERPHDSALGAGFDLLLQLGLIGLVLFVALAGLALARSWLLAGRRSSVVFTWPALVLVALILVSVVESSVLVEFGWLALVICCVKASDELSWRQALDPRPKPVATLPRRNPPA